jgi:hypothetical protein
LSLATQVFRPDDLGEQIAPVPEHVAETIKDALDANGILMPGKQGIWPRRLRQA